MRKIFLSLVLALCLCLPAAFTLSGCQEKHTHTYSEDWTHDDTYHWHKATCGHDNIIANKTKHNFRTSYSNQGDVVLKKVYCEECNRSTSIEVEETTIVSSTEEAVEFLANADEDNIILYLADGDYGVIEFFNGLLTEAYENLTIIAHENAKVDAIVLNTHQAYAPKNLVIDGVHFDNEDATQASGIAFYIPVEKVTITNCVFEKQSNLCLKGAAQNVTIKNNIFKNLANDAGTLSAIYLYEVDGVLIENNIFDNIQYNAMQIMDGVEGSDVEIKDNVFKDVESRVIYFTGSELVGFNIAIYANTFFLKDGDKLTKKDGNYVKSNYEQFSVGVNKWEVIPEATEVYFSANVTYSPEGQMIANIQ